MIGLMDAIKAIQPPGKWKIVVVDSKSIGILNASCKMYDILEENVSIFLYIPFSDSPTEHLSPFR
ncbi:hypothetical protein BC941DRAFT_352196 [Chlamydoabsidia padenii]|nr:hypothetical protein BC941DRAFT_352196 [Chlamydoabsidia padenii]